MATKSSKPTESTKSAKEKAPVKSKAPKKVAASETIAKAPTKTKAATIPEKAPAIATRKKKAVRASPTKAASKISLDPKDPTVEPVIPHDEISLRAYYIGERRQKMGWPGNSGSDWIDAVNQLRAEALEKPLKKR